jgi:hypothetical protein
MMQRLFAVSSTYLKFTFACMLAGTAVFSLTGLAIASPKIFLLVIAVAVAAFFVVRMEVKSWRHAREISDGTSALFNSLEESFAEIIALSEAANLLVPNRKSEPVDKIASLWFTEWAVPDRKEIDEQDLAKTLALVKMHRNEILGYGLQPVYVTRQSANEMLQSLPATTGIPRWSFARKTPPDISQVNGSMISIVFVQHKPVTGTIPQIDKIASALHPFLRFTQVEILGQHVDLKADPKKS